MEVKISCPEKIQWKQCKPRLEWVHKREKYVEKNIRKARRLFERKIAKNAGKNKQAFFKYVNSRLTVRREITAIKSENGQQLENDKDICETIAKYFKFNSVYLPKSEEDMPEMQEMSEVQIGTINITNEMVKVKLSKLNINKSCGPDDIHPHVLQKTASAMCNPLRIIFQMSLDRGECPED